MIAQEAGRTGCLVENEWPERLRRGVRSALRLCQVGSSEWIAGGYDVHHVVAAGLSGAEPGRRMLARWSISVHSVVNAAIVPRSFHQGHGLHRQEFLHSVNVRLASGAMFAEAILQHGGFTAGVSLCFRLYRRLELSLWRVPKMLRLFGCRARCRIY